ncbi:hypothetical protein QR685DRAFT_430857 [Neurospora intermedia]|uniref:Uncharacterized protein n=1 Tax=Neurospora intermedia TaxID=5142 RepID=A0ABR3DQA5_NEUIN
MRVRVDHFSGAFESPRRVGAPRRKTQAIHLMVVGEMPFSSEAGVTSRPVEYPMRSQPAIRYLPTKCLDILDISTRTSRYNWKRLVVAMYVAIYSVYCTVNMVACNYASDWYMLYPPVALHGTRAQGFACLAIRHISFLGMVSWLLRFGPSMIKIYLYIFGLPQAQECQVTTCIPNTHTKETSS